MKNREIFVPALLLCLKNVGILVAASLLLLAVGLLLPNYSDSPIPFDSEVWKHQEDSNERLRMVSDLKPKLIGISKAEVEQLLGEPAGELEPGYEYSYLLGVHRLFFWPIDGIWLSIKFESGRVSDVQVMQD